MIHVSLFTYYLVFFCHIHFSDIIYQLKFTGRPDKSEFNKIKKMSDSIYNEDELVSPDWLNKEFFEMVISKYEKTSLVLVNFPANISSTAQHLKILISLQITKFHQLPKKETTTQVSCIEFN